jgi:hypothetical protein
MANLFDVNNAPSTEPLQFAIGDFVQWKREDIVGDYPTATHSATWIARLASGTNTEITVNATETSTYYLFTIASADSASFSEGHYHWQLEITETSSGNRIIIDTGTLDIHYDLDNNVDPRSHAQIMIDKIESILQGKADADVASYSINGRSLTKMSFEDLISARDFYRKEYAKELQKERAAQGDHTGATVLVRF